MIFERYLSLMKIIFVLTLFFCSFTAAAQSNAEQKIRHVLEQQRQAWNRGDVVAFMQGYVKSDSLMFIGKDGIQWGWQKTLDNYRKSYPDAAAMGQLRFDIIQVKKLSKKYYFVVGKWMLQRTAGNLSGHFNLIFEKRGNDWVIIADHSS